MGARGGTWAGFPVLTSTACPEGIIVLVDPDYVAVAMGNPNVRVSQEAAVDMSDASSMTSGPSVSAANLTSLFQVNGLGLIGSMNANWRLTKAEAVQAFDAQAYGLSGGL